MAEYVHVSFGVKFADLTFAQQVYDELVTQLLANGTTTALYFATIHYEASRRLAEICAAWLNW